VEDAEDVLQVIFVRLLRSHLTPSVRQNLKPYLYRAAVNQSLEIIKSRRRHVLTDDLWQLAASAPTDDSALAEKLHSRLYEAIAKLRPHKPTILPRRKSISGRFGGCRP
jgi:DNA-directed RNA polymerase specialized sigma24 family protein